MDETTKESIATDVNQTGRLNDPYSTTPIDVKDYALDIEKTPENATGIYSNEKQIVTYYYKKVEAPVVNNSTVTTKFIDEETNKEIAEPVVQTGRVTDPYVTSAIGIKGYKLDIDKKPVNASGVYTKEEKTVNYYYKKVESPVMVTGIVTVKFVDEATNKEISRAVKQSGRINDPYKAVAKKITGYALDLEKLPKNREGVYTNDNQEVIFYYTSQQSGAAASNKETTRSDSDLSNKSSELSFYENKHSVSPLPEAKPQQGRLPDTGEKTRSLIGWIGLTLVSSLAAIQFVRMKK